MIYNIGSIFFLQLFTSFRWKFKESAKADESGGKGKLAFQGYFFQIQWELS